MTITYKHVNYRFDTKKWAQMCDAAVTSHGLMEIAEMIDVHPNTLTSWIKRNYKGDFPFPSMNKFINLCGLMDIDPAQFFTILDE